MRSANSASCAVSRSRRLIASCARWILVRCLRSDVIRTPSAGCCRLDGCRPEPSSSVELYRAALQREVSDQISSSSCGLIPPRHLPSSGVVLTGGRSATFCASAAWRRLVSRCCANEALPDRSRRAALPRRRPGGACDVSDGRRGGKVVIQRAGASALTPRFTATAETSPLSASSVHDPRSCATA